MRRPVPGDNEAADGIILPAAGVPDAYQPQRIQGITAIENPQAMPA
ncbi:hypothetical protein ACS8Y6_02295 [Salinisphaera sp. RV14]